MRTSDLKRIEVILGLLALGFAVCSTAPGCVHRIPPGYRLGLNEIIPGQPQYWLDVGRATFGYKAQHLYTFDIISSERPFSRALLTLREEDPSIGCGIGEFSFDTEHYFRDPVCRNLIITTERPFTQMAPLIWKSPSCGCVIVNATVLTKHNEYFTDVSVEGRLTTRLCPRVHSDEQKPHVKEERGLAKRNTKTELSYTDRVALLCKIAQQFTEAEILNREMVLKRRGISKSRLSELLKIEHALERRRGDIRHCCEIQSHGSQARCFGDMRRRRIDRYCGEGEPDVPFTMKRAKFMKDKEAECCWRRGESRYDCFGNSANLKPEKMKESLEYSLDEMDPVNDIADYPTEIEEIEKDINSKYFKANEGGVVSDETPVTKTSVTTTPATKTPVTTRPVTSASTTTTTATTAATQTGTEQLQRDSNSRRQRQDPVKRVIQELAATVWKSELKLKCCREGKSYGDSMDKDTGIYQFCRSRWRGYRRTLDKGKNMCLQKFMECCVNEAEISTTQAYSTKQVDSVTNVQADLATDAPVYETQQRTPKGTSRKRKSHRLSTDSDKLQGKTRDIVVSKAVNERGSKTSSKAIPHFQKPLRHDTTRRVTMRTTTEGNPTNSLSTKPHQKSYDDDVSEEDIDSHAETQELKSGSSEEAEKTSGADKKQTARLRDLDRQRITTKYIREIQEHLQNNPSELKRLLRGDGHRRQTHRTRKHGHKKSKSSRGKQRTRHRHHKHRQTKPDQS